MPEPSNLRPAVRMVLADTDDRVLLVRWRFGEVDVWGTPGGGVDPGESHHDALHRELLEETGLDLVADGHGIGRCVGHRTHVFPIGGGYDGQEEWYYFSRIPSFEPRGRFSTEQLAAEHLVELRWLTLDQVRTLPDTDRVLTAPRDLAGFLARLLMSAPPERMIELGV